MTNFIIGAIFGIAVLLFCIYIKGKSEDRKLKKEFGEDYEIRPKSKEDIQYNVTICADGYCMPYLDDDNNIYAFISINSRNIENAEFYYSLFTNKQKIKLLHNDNEYIVVITQINIIDENTLNIYYTVL